MVRLHLDPDSPDAALIARAAAVIKAGGLVALPTDTLYGLSVNPFDAAAVQRVFVVKGRTMENALPLIASDVEQISRMLGTVDGAGAKLAASFWPGPLTILMTAPPALPHEVTGATGRVGVRVPAHTVSRQLCAASGSVLTATSANISGQPASNDPDRVAATIGGDLDVLLDAGKAPGGLPSTIVDTTGPEPRLVRAGAISWERILQCLMTARP